MIDILYEDKVVKFNGQMYPDSGWCMVLAGGPGSGKSTARKNLIPLEGKILDPDDISNYLHKHFQPKTDYQRKKYGGKYKNANTGEVIDPTERFSQDEMTMKNPEYVEYLYNLRGEIKNSKWHAMFANAIKDGDLPNIIFDTTGRSQSKIDNAIRLAKSLGYKTSLVYIFADIDVQLKNNANRERVVPEQELKRITYEVYETLLDMVNNSNIPGSTMDIIDEVWAVCGIDVDLKTREGKLEYIKTANVFNIKKMGEEIKLDVGDIYDFIKSQMNKIDPNGNTFKESYYLSKVYGD